MTQKSPSPSTTAPARHAAEEAHLYWQDAAQRAYLFLDVLLDRGNNYREHQERGTPPLLKFEHEVVLDGQDLAQPCNYALLRLCPPEGMPVDPAARPVVVVDPRAGHGPGIGGFKFDSEVGMAMTAGHPVYFVTFRPEPHPAQTLFTVMDAEALFLEAVIARHPQCKARPVVIGNCQAGWAMMALNATRPDLFGPLMIMGAPVSYWAGSSQLNPMRYSGGTLGGSWLASLTADMNGGIFDGVHLVQNFENLNPANSLWGKYYNLWSHVDSESERFLAFERWWGGFFRMTGAEIESIVENLFVGNRLARGTIQKGDQCIDLRNIESPVVVFASWGDNITPPPQALNWIVDAWGDERAIAAAGRTIVYVLHESVGHLGIFVGTEVARKEHEQLVASLDVLESLPPGLYEMKLKDKDGQEPHRWDGLEPGQYSVHYEHRTMDDLKALNPEGREEEAIFSTLAKVSEVNASFYKSFMRPWVRMLHNRPLADAMASLNPMRLQHSVLSDRMPAAPLIRSGAQAARAERVQVGDDNVLRQLERQMAAHITDALNRYRDTHNAHTVQWVRSLFGPSGLGAIFKPDVPDADIARARAQQELKQLRELSLAHIDQGGFPQAVCRIVLAGMVSTGAFERRSLRLARLLAGMPGLVPPEAQRPVDWVQVLREQARITAVAPVEALNALDVLLPDLASREHALAVSAAVLMIEPTLDNPRSEIIEYLMGTLGVEPTRVMDLACQLTSGLEAGEPVKSVAAAAQA